MSSSILKYRIYAWFSNKPLSNAFRTSWEKILFDHASQERVNTAGPSAWKPSCIYPVCGRTDYLTRQARMPAFIPRHASSAAAGCPYASPQAMK